MAKETGASPAPTAEILLIEDEEGIRVLVSRFLEMVGFTVLAVATGKEAVKAFQEHGDTIRLVLSDVVLPGGMDGLQIMAALRQLRPGLPFCLMTGDSGKYTVSELMALGPAHLFLKPFNLPEMVKAVSKMLRPSGA